MPDKPDATPDVDGDLEPDRCFVRFEGRTHAILNWQLRRSISDAIISWPLSREEQAAFQKYRDEGQGEQAIFGLLFPPPVRKPLAVSDLQKKTKNQLIHLIMNKLGCSLPSLMKMTKVDLCALYLALGRRAIGLGADSR